VIFKTRPDRVGRWKLPRLGAFPCHLSKSTGPTIPSARRTSALNQRFYANTERQVAVAAPTARIFTFTPDLLAETSTAHRTARRGDPSPYSARQSL